MPGGALVDEVRSARLVAILAAAAICLSALALAIWASFLVVTGARVLHAAASCVLGPVIAAISLGLVGHAALGARLGRNARFGSIGNGFGAAAMGLCGYVVSNRAVFFLTAALAAQSDTIIPFLRKGAFDPGALTVLERWHFAHRIDGEGLWRAFSMSSG
jgi:hypothetical protein